MPGYLDYFDSLWMLVITQSTLDYLESLVQSFESKRPIESLYLQRLETSFSSEVLWMWKENHVKFVCLYPEEEEHISYFREYTSIILMQRGYNG
jgi:hypothetical protein